MRAAALFLMAGLALVAAPACAQNLVNGQSVVATPTSSPGAITVTSTTLNANVSTQIAAANPNRIALGIQCASGGVSISETGATLAGASVGNGSLFIPTGTAPYFTPPVATLTALTAYTAAAQTCIVTEYQK